MSLVVPGSPEIGIDAFTSFTLAILLLFLGKGLSARVGWLRRYAIPEPVIGGVLCALAVCTVFYTLGWQVSFSLDVRDGLLLYFFAAIGLSSDVRNLRQGGRPLVVLGLLACGFMVVQNLVGMALAGGFGMDPRAGLMVGSISLTGGVGTTLAWTPYFDQVLGLAGAADLGLAANMIGLVAACVIGGPVASYLIKRHQVTPSHDAQLEVGTLHEDEPHLRLDYFGVLLAVLWLNLALMLGRGISALIAGTGLNLPAFVGCLLAGIAIRAVANLALPPSRQRGPGRLWNWRSMQPGVALISDISLGLFLTMALMGLQLWALQHVLAFISVAMLVQIVLTVLFTVLVVFRCMGRNYDAVVMCSGFGGITLGSTATAIANMTAVSRQYGAAPQAFIVVPLVCGFVIDLANAAVIGVMAR